jgi:hypothetical protein
VLEFAPGNKHDAWIYATCCMSLPSEERPIELHLLSPVQSDLHVELLYIVAHYHRTGARLDWSHTVNFGRPWLEGATCSYGLISLPYLDGPDLELLKLNGPEVRCLWLLPITEDEREFKRANGLDALEEKLECAQVNYLDPRRASVL